MTELRRHNSTFRAKPSRWKPKGKYGFKGKKRLGASLKRGKRLSAKPDRKLAEWSRKVRERDENRCQFPEVTCLNRGTLHAHHIAPRSRRPDLIYELDNGVTLCFIHHQWVHDNPIEATTLGLLSDETYEAAAKQRKAA